MQNNRLSDLEIKMINTTKNFVKELNETKRYCGTIGMKELQNGVSSISVNNAEKGAIHLMSNIVYKKNDKIPKSYREMLINEIPEIKDRIKMKWVK
jgi:hypothetical protein